MRILALCGLLLQAALLNDGVGLKLGGSWARLVFGEGLFEADEVLVAHRGVA